MKTKAVPELDAVADVFMVGEGTATLQSSRLSLGGGGVLRMGLSEAGESVEAHAACVSSAIVADDGGRRSSDGGWDEDIRTTGEQRACRDEERAADDEMPWRPRQQ